MKKLLMVGMAALLMLAGGGGAFAQEYKLFFSGSWQGSITATRDTRGKITITPRVTTGSWEVNHWTEMKLTHSLCPLVPEGKEFSVFSDSREIVIDGNTTTVTRSSDHITKMVVDGNTTTTTFPTGEWNKTVVDGNTTTVTWPSGSWTKTVVDGNTTTVANKDGILNKTVVDGNTTTLTYAIGRWEKTVIDGNTTIRSTSLHDVPQMTVVDRQGYNIYIFIGTAYDLRLRGDEYYKQKDYDNAIADYTRAIRLDPTANSYSSRGRMFSDKGDYDRAISDFTEAIRLNPQYDYAYSMRGYVYALKKDYRNAIPDYEAALRINPNLTSTKNNLESARKQVR